MLSRRARRVKARARAGADQNKERDEGAKQRGVLALASARLWEDRRCPSGRFEEIRGRQGLFGR